MSDERLLGTTTQGVDESKVYSVDTTDSGGTPTNVAVVVKAYSPSGWSDVTATVMPAGSAQVDSNTITLPPLTALTAGTTYRVEVQYTSGSNTLEDYLIVVAEL